MTLFGGFNITFNGIDYLLKSDEYTSLLKNKRLGLITSPAALTMDYESTIDVLNCKYHLSTLFSPEHGVRGDRDAGEMVEGYIDQDTGINVYSLYRSDGKRLKQEMLKDLDVMLIDLQEVGARYYTFLYTTLYAIEDCAKAGVPIIILDRFNPLGGYMVEGNCLKNEFRSFVGDYTLCMRYGMTIGEFANMANIELKLNADLTIIPCYNLHRNEIFPKIRRPFVMPSIGIPRFESALLYPGICLLEGTNVSEGRGTSAPFEIIGAPFINGKELCDELRKLKLPGIVVRPIYFTPTASKHKGISCQGIQILITNAEEVRSVTVGICLLTLIRDLYPQKFEFLSPNHDNEKPMIDLLSGDDILRTQGLQANEILEMYEKDTEIFRKRKQRFHIYS